MTTSLYTVRMNASILDLFVQAATEVFNEIGFQGITIADEAIDSIPADLLANIGIAGDLQGYFIFRSDIQSATKFIGKMLANLEIETEEKNTFGQFHKEAIGEVLNQVSGRSTMYLSEKQLDCDITPPTIIIGKNVFIDLKSMAHCISKSITGDFGKIGLIVGIKNSQNK